QQSRQQIFARRESQAHAGITKIESDIANMKRLLPPPHNTTRSNLSSTSFNTKITHPNIIKQYTNFINTQKKAFEVSRGKFGLPNEFKSKFTLEKNVLKLTLPNKEYGASFISHLKKAFPN